ncbi:GNAT family N-acetyltransferase [Pectobacterium aroidearum]|uniref:GNAT family N-acetyltransferase n=1 Tax=Pectobacterium aroidearum TaxID=1201031 RepID=A0ABR5ZBH4_9GAMM|nr:MULTISPECIES: GNAT family N-acetyltransferase [Pectobacterium]MBA5199056.1 GNAT family N-acetyltransferase [Pectobacterium aroidearum]MBA5226465.1 GNAT family N-acetyltransferase [Pectobacterium aroidearum]MBA5231848.1 GNAT family N-acetyltransferase [Pectobacterium aroidearum]MBA5239016.1 GNAT family N-acetyltransferase [Pectobacterium aroidearum]MBA5737012.1 GNAT family N-acetyltransferase [Pectobacterium aroidearum]
MEWRNITLRPATSEDERFLFELRRTTMDEHLQRAGVIADDSAHWQRVKYHYDDAHIVLMGSEPIGLFKRHKGVNEWIIIQIQMLPAYQGQGIAAWLLHTFLRQADEANVPVTLSVLKGNRAIRLYQRLGFQTIDNADSELKMKRSPKRQQRLE